MLLHDLNKGTVTTYFVTYNWVLVIGILDSYMIRRQALHSIFLNIEYLHSR